MTLRLYNTLTGKIEEVRLEQPGKFGLYVCGVTPYSESHIGHAMSALVYDVLVRYLRWPGNAFGGLDVTYVSNYTDVDDKLIDRGRELGVDPLELAHQNIAQWEDEQRALNLLPPDHRPRVSTHIPEIIALTERLVANGSAYATASGDVYFRVRADNDYGKLSHRNIDDLRAGTRFEPGEEKEFPLDFALWKAEKPGEPSWDSPWGSGRPGWHIECSAMSQRYLGDTFEVHGGGLDLVFPHHENEVAQSESATGKPFARIWMHNGLVLRDGEKMSKSIGNVISAREALERWSADAIRLFVLSSHYRSPNNVTEAAIDAATRSVARIANALREGGRDSDALGGLIDDLSELQSNTETLATPSRASTDGSQERAEFVVRLEDDFNTAQALATVFGLVRSINTMRDAGEDVRPAQAVLRELTGILGLTLEERADTIDEQDRLALIEIIRPYGDLLNLNQLEAEADRVNVMLGVLGLRLQLRRDKRFSEADSIRTAIEQLGYELEDRPDGGTRWKSVAKP